MKFLKKLKIRRVVGDSMSPTISNNSLIAFLEISSYKIGDIVLVSINNTEYIKKISAINDSGLYYFVSEDYMGLDSRVWGFQSSGVIKAKLLFIVNSSLYKKCFEKVFKSK